MAICHVLRQSETHWSKSHENFSSVFSCWQISNFQIFSVILVRWYFHCWHLRYVIYKLYNLYRRERKRKCHQIRILVQASILMQIFPDLKVIVGIRNEIRLASGSIIAPASWFRNPSMGDDSAIKTKFFVSLIFSPTTRENWKIMVNNNCQLTVMCCSTVCVMRLRVVRYEFSSVLPDYKNRLRNKYICKLRR